MARTIRDEVLRWNLVINGDSARKELNDLNQEQKQIVLRQKELERESRKLERAKKTETVRYREVQAELKQLNATYGQNDAKIKQLQSEIGITSKTMAELRKESAMLRQQLAHTVPGTKAFQELESRLKIVNTRMDELRGKSTQASFSIGKLADGFNRYSAIGATVIATITGIVLSINKFLDMNSQLADQEANVMKTTGLTKEAVAELRGEFDQWNTRTPRMELLKLAEEAGRLGKETKFEVLEFVKTANMIKVALGDDLGESDAIRDVGKLTEQFRIGALYGVSFGRAMEMLGSSINAVSASGSNMAPFLVDFSKRIAGIDNQVNIGAANIIGYAAALDESGQSAETSSTVFNRVIPNMFKDPATYAKIAGMAVGDFSNLLKTDANEALLLFLEGLKGNGEGFEVMAKNMDGLGLDGARAISVLASLSNNTDKVRERQLLANEALREGTSLIDEYNIKNTNAAANIARISRQVYQAFISTTFVKGLRDATEWLMKFIDVPVSQTMLKERMALRDVEMQLLQTNLKREDKVRLVNELKQQYPAYLQNIDAETSSNTELFKAIGKINDELINKIILQKEDERIQEQNDTIAKARMQVIEQEKRLRLQAIRLAEQQGLALPEGVNTLDQMVKLANQLKSNEIFQGRLFNPVVEFRHQVVVLQKLQKHMEGMEQRGNMMMQEREQLIQRLGIRMNQIDSTAPPAVDPASGFADEEHTLEDRRKMRDENQKQLLLDLENFLKNEEALHAEARAQGKLTEAQYEEGKRMQQVTAMHMRRESLQAYLGQLGADEIDKRKQTEGQIADIRKQAAEWEIQDMEEFSDWSERVLKEHFDKLNEINESEFEKLKARNAQARREAMVTAEIDLLKSKPGSRGEVQARKNILDLQRELELENTQLTEDEKELIRLQYLERMRDVEVSYIKENARIALQSFAALMSSFTALTNNRLQRELDEERAVNDQKKNDLRRQLDSKFISEESYRTRLAALEDEYQQVQREIKTEQFKRQRNADAVQAGINTALAISRALPNIPLSIAAGVLGAAQTAAILATPIPAFAKGKYPVTTTEGKQYQANYSGPVKTGYFSKPTIGLFGEEGKEIVISAPHVRQLEMNYPEVIDAIMHSRMPAFAQGKYNYESRRQYRQEGSSRKDARRATHEMSRGQDIMIAELKTMNEKLDRMIDNPQAAELSWRQYNDFKEKASAIENNYNV